MKKVGFKCNNRGMTLVELLVAMAIFVAAIVPMLYAFVYSTAFNFKSQQTMQSTGIAQAIIEKTKAANSDYESVIKALEDKSILEDHSRFTVGSASHTGSIYYFNDVKALTYTGAEASDAVDAGNSTRRAYDVVVEITNETVVATDYSSCPSMSTGISGNFVDCNTLAAQDEVAQSEIIKFLVKNVITNGSCTVSGGGTKDAKDIFTESDLKTNKVHIERRVNITADDSGVKLVVDYYFAGYEDAAGTPLAKVAIKKTQDGKTYTTNTTIDTTVSLYTAHLSITDDLLVSGTASAVFFYYYPSYDYTFVPGCSLATSSAKFEDHFIINNSMSAPYGDTDSLCIYLFKQYNNDLIDSGTLTGESQLLLLDSHYEPVVDMFGSTSCYTDLYHNFIWDVTGDEYTAPPTITINDDPTNGCFNMTKVVRADAADPMSEAASLRYADTFYMYETDPISHNISILPSRLLQDKSVIPNWGCDRDGGAPAMFIPRFVVTVKVYKSNSSHDHSGETPIETMTGEFLNW